MYDINEAMRIHSDLPEDMKYDLIVFELMCLGYFAWEAREAVDIYYDMTR